MTVTVTYSLDFLQTLDLAGGPAAAEADVASLANGGFAAVGTAGGLTDLNVFAPNFAAAGSALNLPGTGGHVAQLSNGNLVVATDTAGANTFTIRTPAGAAVVSPTPFGPAGAVELDVAALRDGGFVAVYRENGADGRRFMNFSQFNNAGVLLNSELVDVDPGLANPAIAALDDGGFAIAYENNGFITYAVYNANGTVRLPPTYNGSASVDQRHVSIAATNGGFILAFQSAPATGSNIDAEVRWFNSNGGFIRGGTLTGEGTIDASPEVTRVTGNIMAVAFTLSTVSEADSETDVVLLDLAAEQIVAERIVTAGNALTDDTNFPTIAANGSGRIAVFHTNSTDNDVDGEALQAVRTHTGDAAVDSAQGDDLVDRMFGFEASDNLRGLGGGDRIDGGSEADFIDGGNGADTLLGGTGDDRFLWGADSASGLDIVTGGGGADTLDFVIFGAAVQIVLALGAGIEVHTRDSTNVITGTFRAMAELTDNIENATGSAFDDRIFGTAAANFIDGASGNDEIHADAGNDTLWGNFGNDYLDGGLGIDQADYFYGITGGVNVDLRVTTAQNTVGGGIDRLVFIENLLGSPLGDRLIGDGKANLLNGAAGDDLLYGMGGADTLLGGANGDTANGGDGDDGAFGEAGDDILSGDAGDDDLRGGIGADRIYGGADADGWLSGELDNDVIYGGDGNDRVDGGGGDDTFLGGDAGLDYITGSDGDDRIDGGAGNDTWLGGDAGRDTITGGLGNDRIHGGDEFINPDNPTGDTWLGGDAGSDTITGGTGNDRIDGGADNDTFLGGDAGADTITGGTGNDRIDGGADGDAALNGDGGNDTITGGDGDDTANGGDNDDVVYGQAGRDTLRGGLGADTIYGGDEVGLGDILLAGDGGIDWVSGGLGNDRIDGGTENDRYLGGDAGNDIVTGGGGNDRLEGGADSDVLYGEADNDYMLGGTGIDTLYGGAGIDNLFGNDNDDFLQGDGQNDNMYGGTGLDRFNFDLANGSDVVFDFTNNQDTLIIDPLFGLATAAAVLAATIQTGNHARILLPGADTDIYLWNYLAAGSGNTIANLGDDILIG